MISIKDRSNKQLNEKLDSFSMSLSNRFFFERMEDVKDEILKKLSVESDVEVIRKLQGAYALCDEITGLRTQLK